MWHKCEVMRKSNQVHQLKLLQKITLMKDSEFCEDMPKSKNAKRVTLIIHLWLKCLIFVSFWVELCKTLEKDWQEIKISTRMKKFHFTVKYTVFIKNENENLKNSDFCYTWSKDPTYGLMTILNMWSKFQNDLMNSSRCDILKLYPITYVSEWVRA